MIHGDPQVFAIEAIVEPGPELPPNVGRSVAGRVRVIICGQEFGDFEEPCCVLQPLADHLLARASPSVRAWAERLAPLKSVERFNILDGLFYSVEVEDAALESQLRDACFLTNESEAFDPIKGFVLREGLNMHILLQRDFQSTIDAFVVPVDAMAKAAHSFGQWLASEQTKLAQRFGP